MTDSWPGHVPRWDGVHQLLPSTHHPPQLPTGAVTLRLPLHLEYLAVLRQHLSVQRIGLRPLSQGLRKTDIATIE